MGPELCSCGTETPVNILSPTFELVSHVFLKQATKTEKKKNERGLLHVTFFCKFHKEYVATERVSTALPLCFDTSFPCCSARSYFYRDRQPMAAMAVQLWRTQLNRLLSSVMSKSWLVQWRPPQEESFGFKTQGFPTVCQWCDTVIICKRDKQSRLGNKLHGWVMETYPKVFNKAELYEQWSRSHRLMA